MKPANTISEIMATPFFNQFTETQIRVQVERNAHDLRTMHAKAKRTGKKVGGFTELELNEIATRYEKMKTGYFVCVNINNQYATYTNDGQLGTSNNIADASKFALNSENVNLNITRIVTDQITKERVPMAVYTVRHLMNDSTFTLKHVS